MLKILSFTFVAIILSGCSHIDIEKNKRPERKIAVQMYSLHDVSMKEAFDKLKETGIKAVECYPGHKIGGKYPNTRFSHKISAEQLSYVKGMLKNGGFEIVSYGVTSAANEKEVEDICKFTKELGAKRVITEAKVIHFPLWQKYCEKYNLTMCLHHHALDASNQYYDTYVVKKYTAPYSRIKANPDVGHWVRSGISAVESIKDLNGRIASIHIKDEDAFGEMDSRATVLGKGFVNIPEVLKELDKQGYDGYFVIEYEDDWGKNIPHIKACADYLKNN